MDSISAALRRLNVRRIARDLGRLLPNQDRLIIYDRPSQESLVGRLRERLRIYLAVDDLTVTVGGKTLSEDLEAEKRLLSKVDIVVCVSEVLAQRLRERSQPRRTAVHVLPNGYDAQIFDPKRDLLEPKALSNVSRPRILVAGHISERIDWEGIARVSALRPAWTWVFTGPAEQGMRERIRNDLGVHGFWHPPIPVTEVPAWISHCEASAVPYRLNSFTLASCPMKAIEYLAMGAPVLSTRIPALQHYDRAIEWVDEGDGESYVRALDAFAKQQNSQQLKGFRQNAVIEDSWSRRVEQFRQIVFAELRLRTGNSD
jgi:glycosyltransferase involved in cell wall biosynthesis